MTKEMILKVRSSHHSGTLIHKLQLTDDMLLPEQKASLGVLIDSTLVQMAELYISQKGMLKGTRLTGTIFHIGRKREVRSLKLPEIV